MPAHPSAPFAMIAVVADRKRTGRRAAGLIALFLPFALSALTSGSAATVTPVGVTAKDYGFTLSRTSLPVGGVRFVVRNDGFDRHDFAINGAKTAVLEHGTTTELNVLFTKPGRYRFY